MRSLIIAASLAAAAFGQPAAGRPDPVLEAARIAALHYSRTLPDFLCNEFVRRFSQWQGQEFRIDTLNFQVGFFHERESYRLLQRDGYPSHQNVEALNGSRSEGEFGSALRLIFEPESEAVFQHEGRHRIRGRAVEVYSYAVPLARSRYKLLAGSKAALTAYHGRVSIDPAANRVLRLTMAVDPPADFPIRETETTIDYDLRKISGASYLLPVRAEVFTIEAVPVAPRRIRYRNLIEFRNYRKFTADSKLTFTAPAPN